MTNAELHLYFLKKAEESEARAVRRMEQIRAAEERELGIRWQSQRSFWKDRDFDIELDMVTAKSRSNDPVWKSHVADNQWFMQKAVMYGTAATNERLVELLTLLTTKSQTVRGMGATIPRQRGESDG